MEKSSDDGNVDWQAKGNVVNESIKGILSQNFDAVSIPALITITKYVTNIINNPVDPKFRAINTSNKVFMEKVIPAKGIPFVIRIFAFAEDLLCCIIVDLSASIPKNQ